MSIPAPSGSSGDPTEGLVVDGVSIVFSGDPQVQALEAVRLAVPRGEFAAVVGPSGCGKSTLLRLVAGLLTPTTGSISVHGRTPAEAQADAEFGFVFQDPVLFPWLTAIDNVLLPVEILGARSPHRGREGDHLARRLLHDVGLVGFENLYPAQLSGGMRQRVSLARALVYEPSLLLMDEPFGALDEFTRDRLNLLLLQIWTERRPTVVFVTHSIAEALFLADEVAVLSARPGSVIRSVRVPFPRPRTFALRFSPLFVEMVGELRQLLEGAARHDA